jgi:hypothetical protein
LLLDVAIMLQVVIADSGYANIRFLAALVGLKHIVSLVRYSKRRSANLSGAWMPMVATT